MDSERNFLVGAAVILVGICSFGLGHIQGRSAGPLARERAQVGPVYDDFYAFVPGGTAGTVEVVGLPSGKTLTSVPVLETRRGRGHATPGSDLHRQLLESGSMGGDIVAVAPSHDASGVPDGKALFAVDRANSRIARLELQSFSVAALSERLPLQGLGDAVHIPGGDLVVTSEFPGEEGGHLALVDPGSLAIKLLIRVPHNAARCAVAGDWLLVTSYDAARSVGPYDRQHQMAVYDDHLLAIDLSALGRAKAPIASQVTLGGETFTLVDLTAKNTEGAGKLYRSVPVPPGAAGVTVTPDGKHALVSCRWSGSVAIVDLKALPKAAKARDAVVAEPVVGYGPTATFASADGYAYTTLFEKSELVRWSVKAAVAGESRYIQARTKASYMPVDLAGAVDPASGEARFLLAQGAAALDQFLPVGGNSPAALSLYTIEGGPASLRSRLPLDSPTRGAAILSYDRVAPHVKTVASDWDVETPPQPSVKRADGKVHVHVVVSRGSVQPTAVEIKAGEKVELTVHNLDRVPGMRQGLVVTQHGVMLDVPPGGTRRATFVAGEPGSFWYYTTRPTALGAPEARGRMTVTAPAK